VKRYVAISVALATLVAAPVASAQGPTIQAVDGPPPELNNRWEPANVAINPGETVTWSFAGTTGFHNVQSSGSNWNPTFRNGEADRGLPPASYTFTNPGVYVFECQVHANTMRGTVTVGNPPPPPPPPLSEQHWANEQQPPSSLERTDETRPRLSRVRARAVRDGARVRFRLSERARVTVRVKLAGVTIKAARKTFGKGSARLTVRDRRIHGRYRVEVVARDLGGNRSRSRARFVYVR
jgi:plastocyanin